MFSLSEEEFGAIKRRILVFNDKADAELRQIKEERIKLHKDFKSSFERLSEVQQLSYTNAMTRDAALIAERDFDPEELESDYYITIGVSGYRFVRLATGLPAACGMSGFVYRYARKALLPAA